MPRKKKTSLNIALQPTYEECVAPYLELVTEFREQGCNFKKVCDKLNINYSTGRLWIKKHPEFLEAWELGQISTALKLEETALKEAYGYNYTETEILKDKEGKVYATKVRKKYRPPQIPILLRYLETLYPQKWKQVDMKDDKDIEIKMSDDLKEYAE